MLAVIGSNDFVYKLLFLLHILSALVAFAPAFVWSVTNVQLRGHGGVGRNVSAQVAKNSMLVHGPAMVLTGVFGLLMVVSSAEVGSEGAKIFEFSQMWISLAFLLWFAMIGVLFGLQLPAEKAVAGGDEAAEKKVAMFGGIGHLLLFLMLIVMIWKPGLG